MKTDLSHWYKLKSKIKIEQTKQKFYGKFNHKIVYNCHGCQILTIITDAEQLITRVATSSSQTKAKYDLTRLLAFFEVYKRKGSTLRFRTEGSSLSIFSDQLDILYSIASNDLSQYKHNIQSLTTLLDTSTQQHLDANKILVVTPTEYKWRINLRPGFYHNTQEKLAFYNYLKNLGDQVKVSDILLFDLTHGHKYIRASYLQVRERTLADMLYLIIPGIVKSIQEIVVLPQSK